ncbi:phytoene/squalene synthase family protein [Salinicoccus sp. HZC-1]|uniref:phytoene/squalene synthase family protein n=1 Tax=Salinicoccus sp. HZC-1 TaxID=3385497 RepID=UPI00398AE9C7
MMNDFTPSLKSDYNQCQTVIKQYSKSFYYAFSSLPADDADAVYAVYAFCRRADDAIDHAGTETAGMENLERLKRQLDDFIGGTVPDDAMWRALDDVRNRYDIDTSMLYSQIKGQQMDIHFEQPASLDDLVAYSNYVAGSVGRLLLPILSNDCSQERQEKAEKLGVAMQITNVLRDVGEDIKAHRRVYIPADLLERYGCSLKQIENAEINTAFIDVWEHLGAEAERLYDEFRTEIIHYKEEARLPLLVSLSVYREILSEVRNNDYDCFNRRNAVPLARKMKIRDLEKYFIENLKDG